MTLKGENLIRTFSKSCSVLPIMFTSIRYQDFSVFVVVTDTISISLRGYKDMILIFTCEDIISTQQVKPGISVRKSYTTH